MLANVRSCRPTGQLPSALLMTGMYRRLATNIRDMRNDRSNVLLDRIYDVNMVFPSLRRERIFAYWHISIAM